MNIYLGENLKKLRNEKDMTQEALAAFLGVSFQAISKWERGENFPDIETLINIAHFFNTSVDDLLGVNQAENEKEILKIIEQYDNLTDVELQHKIITDAIKKFPTDFRIQLRRMGDLCFSKNGRDYEENYPKVKAIYDNIQLNCTIDTIRICSKRYLAMYYNTLAHYEVCGITHEDCEKIIDEMPHMRDGKEFLSSYLYGPSHPNGVYHLRNAIEEELCCLYHGLYHYIFFDNAFGLQTELVIEMNEKMLDIANSFYDDGHYGKMWRFVMESYVRLGYIYFENGNSVKAIKNLKKSTELAKQFDNMDRITTMHSKLFEGKEFDKHTLGSTFIASSRMKTLMTEKYALSDEFKSSPEFAEILEMLE